MNVNSQTVYRMKKKPVIKRARRQVAQQWAIYDRNGRIITYNSQGGPALQIFDDKGDAEMSARFYESDCAGEFAEPLRVVPVRSEYRPTGKGEIVNEDYDEEE